MQINEVIRGVLDFINIAICWCKRKQLFVPKTDVVKCNLGSGIYKYSGWINIDGSIHSLFSKYPKFILKVLHHNSIYKRYFSIEEYISALRNNIYIHHNLEYGIPFQDNSIDSLVSSHLLEHLYREDAERLLKEVYRVLKCNGTARICVPFAKNHEPLSGEKRKETLLKICFAHSKEMYFSRHKSAYNYELLKQSLKEAGFLDVRQCSYQQWKALNIPIRVNDGLYVEAVKQKSF